MWLSISLTGLHSVRSGRGGFELNLDSLLKQLGNEDQLNRFPLDEWSPAHCGDIDIRIAKDGTWWHEGSRIRRERLVRLFSALLICEAGEYFLITPAEKARIQVEDRALHVVFIDVADDVVTAVTADGRCLPLGDEHPLRFSDLDGVSVPEVYAGHGLWARFNRNAFYELSRFIEEGDDGQLNLCLAGRCYPVEE